MKKFIFIIIVLFLSAGSVYYFQKEKKSVENLPTAKIYKKTVKTVLPKKGLLVTKKQFLAEVLPDKKANISTKIPSYIKNIYVSENDFVKKGDLLISLDDREILANLSSLKSQKQSVSINVKNAENVFNRNKKLFKIEAISKENFDNSKAILENQLSLLQNVKDKIKQVESQLEYLNIVSPFEGVVGSKLLDVGSLAPVGKTILTINSLRQKIIFSFSQNEKELIKNGQKVFLKNNQQFIGVISKIYNEAKNSLLVAEVEVKKTIPYSNNSYINIDIEINNSNSCILPTNSILHKNGNEYVMIYKDNKFLEKKVNIILENDNNVSIGECFKYPVAIGSEAKLSVLPTYGKIFIAEEE